MSKTIDERVVSMQFDNKNFESNVQTSLSTLDKLKRSLNLTGASKGLENVSAAAKNVNLSTLGGAVEAVRMKFSALEVMGVTALANITNSAVNAGKRMVSALTIEPVKTGFNEYELKMDSVKTIMASTGETVETVNKYLEELNEYSDRTIYSFSDMTQNIGKFTNAGVKLEDAVLAMKGISNEAAVSGANANEASRAMYNLAQSMSMGFVQYIDWKSIENANMATVEFKKNLADMAVKLGVLSEANGEYTTSAGDAYSLQALFKDGMKDQWLTTDVLVKTLHDYADETTDIGKKAYAAAQDVTKLSQVFDIAKETAQSGWAKTWEIMFGDIEKAKALFTPLSNFLNKVIDGISDFRNNLLSGALSNAPWDGLSEKIGSIGKAADSITNVTDKLETFQSVVSDVWRGDYGNMWPRWNTLEEEGYNSDVIQDLVNLGHDHKITMEDVEASYKKYGLTLDKSTKSTEKMASSIENLSDAQLKEAGLTDEEIKLYRELQEEAKRTGKPLKELIDSMSEVDGRTLLIESLQNAGSGLVGVFTALKNAWVEIFPPMTSIQLFNLIEGLNKFSEKLRLTDKETGDLTDTAKKLQRIFKGLFALLDIITTVIGGPLKIAFKIICKILDAFGLNILDVAAGIGDAIVGFRDWIDSALDFDKTFDNIVDLAKQVKDAFSNWFDGLMKAEDKPKYIINSIVNALQTAVKAIGDTAFNIGKTVWENIEKFLNSMGIDTSGFTNFVSNMLKEVDKFISGFKNIDGIPKNIISGLLNGLKDGATSVVDFLWNLGVSIIETIKKVLGIHSPSTEMAEVGEFTIEGFVQGLQNGLNFVLETAKDIISKFLEIFKDADLKSIVASVVDIGGLVIFGKVLKTVSNALLNFSKPFESIGNVFNSVSGAINTFSNCMTQFTKAMSFNIKMQAIKSLAIAVAILVGSIVVLTFIPWDKAWMAVLELVAIIGVLVLATILLNKFGSSDPKIYANFALMVISLSVGMLLLAAVMKIIASIDPDRAGQAMTGMIGLFVGIMFLMATIGKVINPKTSKVISELGKTMLKLSISMLLMALLVKMLSGMDEKAFAKGFRCVAELSALIIILMYMTKAAGGNKVRAIGRTILEISEAILLMGITVKLLSGMDETSLENGFKMVFLFAGIIVGLIAATKLVGKNNIDSLGKTIAGVGVALLLMAVAVKILGGMEPDQLLKGVVAIGVMSIIIGGLMFFTNLASERDMAKLGRTLIMLSVCIGILAAIAIVLGMVETKQLIKGVVAVGVIATIVAGLLLVTSFAKDAKGNLIAISIAIGVIAAAVIILSMIDPLKLIPATVALGTLMVIFGGIIFVSQFANNSIASLMVITVAIGLLAAALYLLSSIPAESLIPAAGALGVLMLSLAASLIILSKCSSISKESIVALAAMSLAMVILAGVLYLISGLPIESTIVSVVALTTMLLAITAVCVIMSTLHIGVTAAAEAALALGAFIGILAAVLLALGALTQIPGVNELISSGGETLAAIGYAIGNFIGSIIGGFGAGVTSGLPEMAQNLSMFMVMLTPFIAGASMIDPSMMEGVKALAEVILLLTAAQLLEGITSWLTGGSSMTDFAKQILPFGKAMVKFSETVAGKIDQEAVNAAANAGKTMVELQNSLPGTGGVFQFFAGEKDLEGFGNQLVPFGTAMVRFSDTVAGKIDQEAVQAAANAGSTMVEFQKTLPGTGGVLQFFTGEQDMTAFGAQLVPFGTAIVRFSNIVAGKIDQEAVEAAANAGQTMAEFQKTLPGTGGVFQFFAGEQDMAAFGKDLVPFGTAMVRFSNIVAGKIDQEAVESAANAGTMMSDMQNSLPNSGGIFDIFTGNKDMGAFSNQLLLYGNGIVEFSKVLSNGVDSDAVTAAAIAGLDIVEILNTFPDSVDFNIITNGLNSFGNAMVDFSDIVTGNVDTYTITSVANVGKTLAETASIMPSQIDFANLTEGLTTFGSGMVGFSKSISSGLDTDAITAAADAGKSIADMISAVPPGINMVDFSNGIKTFGDSIKVFAASGAETKKEDVENATSLGSLIGDMVTNHIPDYVDISDFTANVEKLGSAISTFSKSVSGDNELDKDAVTNAVDSGTKIGDMVKNHIPDYMDIGDFVGNVKKLGTAIHAFSKSVSGSNKLDKDAIDNAVDACTKIGDMLINHVPKYVDIGDYVANIPTVGESLSSFSKKVSGSNKVDKDSVSDAVDAGTKIGDMINNHIPQSIEAKDFINNAPKIGSAIKSFSYEIKDVSGDDIVSTMESLKTFMISLEDIADTGVSKFVDPFSKSETKVKDAISKMTNFAVNALDKDGNYTKFKVVGEYLVEGFADGITDNTYKAAAKSTAMAEAALTAAKDTLDINSPSKEFRKIGGYVPEGFAQGIDRLSGLVTRSTEEMAKDSVNSALSSVSYIADVINSDIDAQPTIRPVLDLTNVKAGANTIGGMLSGRTLSINTNRIGSISASMSSRQNGNGSSEIVSAIRALSDDIANAPRDVYNVNGVTYDDGSNIATAVNDLIRAARIERRI